jgi:hypothetical protein
VKKSSSSSSRKKCKFIDDSAALGDDSDTDEGDDDHESDASYDDDKSESSSDSEVVTEDDEDDEDSDDATSGDEYDDDPEPEEEKTEEDDDIDGKVRAQERKALKGSKPSKKKDRKQKARDKKAERKAEKRAKRKAREAKEKEKSKLKSKPADDSRSKKRSRSDDTPAAESVASAAHAPASKKVKSNDAGASVDASHVYQLIPSSTATPDESLKVGAVFRIDNHRYQVTYLGKDCPTLDGVWTGNKFSDELMCTGKKFNSAPGEAPVWVNFCYHRTKMPLTNVTPLRFEEVDSYYKNRSSTIKLAGRLDAVKYNNLKKEVVGDITTYRNIIAVCSYSKEMDRMRDCQRKLRLIKTKEAAAKAAGEGADVIESPSDSVVALKQDSHKPRSVALAPPDDDTPSLHVHSTAPFKPHMTLMHPDCRTFMRETIRGFMDDNERDFDDAFSYLFTKLSGRSSLPINASATYTETQVYALMYAITTLQDEVTAKTVYQFRTETKERTKHRAKQGKDEPQLEATRPMPPPPSLRSSSSSSSSAEGSAPAPPPNTPSLLPIDSKLESMDIDGSPLKYSDVLNQRVKVPVLF